MKLYKFEKHEKDRLETIKEKSLWISPPKKFNDLADSLLDSVWLTTMDKITCKALIEGFETIRKSAPSHLFPFPQEIQESIVSLLLYCIPIEKINKGRESEICEKKCLLVKQVSEYIRKTAGICCFFNGKPNHPLMWAHYANSHKGFCIEYDVDRGNNRNLFEVNYTTKPEAPSIEELLFCPHEVIGRILMRKSHEWSYEKEYRLIYINEFNSAEPGKRLHRPESIRPNKIITGANFKNGEDDLNIENLGIPITSYYDFIKEENQCQKRDK